MIRLRCATTHDLVSRVICGAQLGFPFSHIEAVTQDGSRLGAVVPDGVQMRPADYDKGLWSSQLFVALPSTDEQEKTFWTFLTRQIGESYDLAAIGAMAEGVASVLLGEPQSRGWTCSGLITAALLEAGIIKSAPTTVRLSTPRDVLCFTAALVSIGAIEEP